MVEGSVLDGRIDAQDVQAVQEKNRTQQEFDRKREESIRAQMGDKYPQWQAYEQTRPARVEAAAMSMQLVQAGTPLSAEQIKPLTTALIAERQRQLQEGMSNPRAPPGNRDDPGYRAQMMEESLKRTEEDNRRMLEVATPYLDATQLATLRKQMERQTSVSRQMLGTQTQTQQVQPSPL